MRLFHGTSKETYDKIMDEGILWGKRNAPSRCTYFALDRNEAEKYGDVVLEVEYDVHNKSFSNNYQEGCWQIREYEPIGTNLIVNVYVRKP